METQAPSYRQLAVPVCVGLVALILGIVIWLTFGGSVPLAPQGYRIAMLLPDATDLYPRSDVEISGVIIGRVVEIQRTGNAAKIVAELKPQYAPLRSGAVAIKRTKSLLGEGYIEIAPGPRNAKPIPDGGELAPSHVQRTQSLDDVLRTFAPATRRNLRTLFGGLAAAFAGTGQALNDSLGYAAPVTANLNTVFDTMASQKADLERLFASSADVLTAIAGREATLQAAVTAGNDVLRTTARSSSGLTATVRALPAFLATLRGGSRTITSTTGDLNAAVSALLPVAPKVYPALQAIDDAAPQFRAAFDALPGVINAGDRGLPAVSAITRAAGSSFATIYPVLRQLIPTLQLLATLRGSVSSFFANLEAFTNGKVAAGGVTSGAIGGIPSIWNETLAGWKVRLPTNRPNPYPQPGEPLQIGHGGLLSYDCRQLGNPLYLPATGGSGAPPCILQGPWTFNGISSYYPHPTLAPP